LGAIGGRKGKAEGEWTRVGWNGVGFGKLARKTRDDGRLGRAEGMEGEGAVVGRENHFDRGGGYTLELIKVCGNKFAINSILSTEISYNPLFHQYKLL
jgi:hypothetical protein